MKYSEFSNYLSNELNNHDIKLDNYKIEVLFNYMRDLLEWNDKINLTAITNENEFVMKHYVDSLIATKYVDFNDNEIIDIGTGGGFPGIPMKIALPESRITLVDSINKKLNVIRDIVQKNNIDNINIVHSRAEDLGIDANYREEFDVVVSRAVANLTTLVELLIPFAKVGGKIICMKGPGLEEELDSSRKAISILGGQVMKIENYDLKNEKRKILLIKKTKSTPKNYPRKSGIPLKNQIH